MKYNVGDKVRIQPLEWYQKEIEKEDCYNIFDIFWCSHEMTISKIEKSQYLMEEDGQEFYWTDEMIEGLVEDEMIDLTSIVMETVEEKTIQNALAYGYNLPEGYQFVDENGNVINATKIVLERKKKDVNLTQEQINTIIHDSCVLFCKHCGCGIPRKTCISLGTCKEHDEYRAAMRTHLMKKKKKEYPKTFIECQECLGEDVPPMEEPDSKTHRRRQVHLLEVLLICRDAYWKIAGEEMGLGKPWEPDWKNDEQGRYMIMVYENKLHKDRSIVGTNFILVFPTEEMVNAFYENFKELIEICKELL